jgi:hypothetical protein
MIKKLFILFTLCFMLSGCSILKSVVAPLTPVKNTIPQSTDKSKSKYTCAGVIDYYEDGTVKSCSKGFYAYQENYTKQERKLNLKERVAQFITRSSGYLLIGIILLVIFVPGALGFILGRVLEAIYGIAKVTLNKVTKAVQRSRKEGKDLNEALSAELDEKQKLYIQELKNKEHIK